MQRPSYQSVLERDGQNSKTERRSTRLHSNSGSMPPSRQPMGPMGPGTDQRHIQEQSYLSEIMRIPPNLVAQLKQGLGLDGKEPTAMTFDEKRRLVEAHRQRTQGNLPSSSSNTAMTSDERVRPQFSFLS
ncbi:uncharacterized protein ARMOST_17286 [Armillaria ostoyae]|uniref:Uncharacterized protein n=1 Tax=Armillaria ostoyae TaxID=47428 RepID=A0A284RYP3_ARMOS|nr:uncharacterized protein ARMOST_17286 [Armillaria ostoyae]